MTNEVFNTWVTRDLHVYYPDRSKADGRRMIAKSNSGTGKNFIEALAGMMLNGMHLFPGPNGTEANQELIIFFLLIRRGYMITWISYLICLSKFMGEKQDLQFLTWVISSLEANKSLKKMIRELISLNYLVLLNI